MDTDVSPPHGDDDRLPDELSGLDDGDRHEYAALWRLLRRADTATDSAFSADAAWEDLNDRIAPDAAPTHTTPDRPAQDRPAHTRSKTPDQRTNSFWMRRWAVVTAVLFAMTVGIVSWWSQPVSVETIAGEQTTVTLPDGSVAELNGASTITYPRGFSALPWVGAEERQVTLQGEAFFNVEPAERPFQVITENAAVDVLGTAFNVRARTTKAVPVTEVVLTSGRIQFRGVASGQESVVLSDAGQYSRLEGTATSPSPPEHSDHTHASAWRDGGFSMRNASVPAILQALEAQFGTPIHFSTPADTDPMTLHYSSTKNLEAILQDIAVVQNLQYRKMNQGYELIPLTNNHSTTE